MRQVSEKSDEIDGTRLEKTLESCRVFGLETRAPPMLLSKNHHLLNVTTQRIFINADGEIPCRDAASTTEYLTNVLSSLSFALTSLRFCSADRVDTFTSARRRLTITLKAVFGSGLLQICCIVSSSSEKTDCDQQIVDISLQRFNGL